MTISIEAAERFRALHYRPEPFVIPNPWDAGTARILAALGFEALATTSAGLAFTLGRPDGTGAVGRDEALDNARTIVAATDLPVNADLENGYADDPAAAADTIRLAAEAGLAGGSIEDATGDASHPIYPFEVAVERVRVAAAVAHALPAPFLLTARAENLLHGRNDLGDTIRRLQAFEAAGADVLYAPGLATLDQVRAVCSAVSKPVNVLLGASNASLTLDQLGEAGAKRISVGGALARVALGAFISAARTLAHDGVFAATGGVPSFAELNSMFAAGSAR